MRKLVVGSAAVVLASCGVFGSDEEPAPPPAGPEPTAAAPNQPAPPVTGTPTEDELTEKYGVFVSPTGVQDGDGTRAKPLATIAAGLERAVAERKRLYVCVGTFKESLTVKNGIPTIGGLDCSAPKWTRSTARTKIESPTSPAATAEDIDVETPIDGFEIVAPDATDPGGSSIGLRAKKAGALRIKNTKIAAGNAKPGAAGEEGTQLSNAAAAAGKASVPEEDFLPNQFYTSSYNAGADPGTNVCVGAAGFVGEAGGKGGNGGGYNCAFNTSTQLYQWIPASSPANPSIKLLPTTGEARTGAPGGAGSDGASASASGTFSENGYTPVDGSAGTNGTPGKGGKGGDGGAMTSVICSQSHVGESASGPGGGAGGCPGLAGTAGKGGGASVGVLAFGSAGLTFDAAEIVAGSGGAGGRGSLGSSPTAGGGAGTASGKAGAAGAGGAGGRAGVSGSGAGGPSIAIAHTGGEPKAINGTKLTPGTPGAGVPEEAVNDLLGNAKTLPASAAGVAKDLFAF